MAPNALIVVDVQRDFLPGGALPVPAGEQVVAPLSLYARKFHEHSWPVFATQDWHPSGHASFRERGGLWPPHCVGNSFGARLADGLRLPPETQFIHKGTRLEEDAYSGFDGTDLDERLHAAGATRLFVGGLTTDYCVLGTVRDARRLGYEVHLLEDAIRGVEARPGDSERARREMLELGALPTRLADV